MKKINQNLNIEQLLQERFFIQTFRRGQREIISSVLNGRDTLAVMPTGGGKSLCYQLPSLFLEGIVIVISPLIALMQDQVGALKKIGIPSGGIHSALSLEEKRTVFLELKRSKNFILFLSPERVQKPEFLQWIKMQKISLLAIDEAHCISQWGSDFRPDYHKLKIIRKVRPDIPVLALTATATPLVLEDIALQMSMEKPDRHVYGFYRPNLYYQVEICDRETDKMDFIYSAINKTSTGKILIYCGTRKQCEALFNDLQTDNAGVGYYHAGLPPGERDRMQKEYESSKIRILIATNAFGMGIDHPDVRLVIHFQIPANIESLYQEMGRAGRDTQESTCLVLYARKDKGLHSFFIKESDAPEDVIDRKWIALDTLVEFAEGGECRHSGILTYFKDTQRIQKCGHCDICAPESPRKILKIAEKGSPNSPSEVKKIKPKKLDKNLRNLTREEEIRKMVLQNWRKEYAREKDMPAFMIFSNRTLDELVVKNPENLSELRKIYGLGEMKVDAYGKEILTELEKCK